MNPDKNYGPKIILKIIGRISLSAALICGVVTVLFYIRFDEEPPMDNPVLLKTLEKIYENPEDDLLREQYREWHYLSLGAYFTGRDQYRQGVLLTTIFAMNYLICGGLIRLIFDDGGKSGKPKENKINSLGWESIGLLALLLTAVLLPPIYNLFSFQPGALAQDFDSPIESADGNWNSLRGPLAGRYESVADGVEAPDADEIEILWSLTSSKQGHSSPVIWGDHIYITGADRDGLEIMAIDADSGELIWSKVLPVNPDSLPDVSFDTGWAPSTPVCNENGIFALFGEGSLIALDHEGELVWENALGVPDNPYGHASSLAIYQGRIFIQYDQSDRSFMQAVASSDGRELWLVEHAPGASWASPVPVFYEDQVMLVSVSATEVRAYNPFTGEVLWSADCMSGEIAPSIAWDDQKIFTAQEGAGVGALDIATGELLWRNEIGPQSDVPCPVATDRWLIVPTSYGILSLYDKESGEFPNFHERYEYSYASPVIWDDLIIWPDMAGYVNLYRIGEELELLREFELNEEIMATPAICNGRVIVRSTERLFALGVKNG